MNRIAKACGLLAVFAWLTACSTETLVSDSDRDRLSAESSPAGLFVFPADADVQRHPADGTLRRLSSKHLGLLLDADRGYREAARRGDFDAMSRRFLTLFAQELALREPESQFVLESESPDRLGYRTVRLTQFWRGLPVVDSGLLIHFDPAGQLSQATGDYLVIPDNFVTQPRLSEAQSLKQAASSLGLTECRACTARLLIARDGERKPHLAFEIEVRLSLANLTQVVIDAHDGSVIASTRRNPGPILRRKDL